MGFESNECLKKFSHTSSVSSVIKAPNNKFICGLMDGTMQVLDTESGECLVTIKEYFEAIQNLKLISNERFLMIKLLNCLTWMLLNALEHLLGIKDQLKE